MDHLLLAKLKKCLAVVGMEPTIFSGLLIQCSTELRGQSVMPKITAYFLFFSCDIYPNNGCITEQQEKQFIIEQSNINKVSLVLFKCSTLFHDGKN